MNLDFSTLYALWATDFFQKNEILLLCFGDFIASGYYDCCVHQ